MRLAIFTIIFMCSLPALAQNTPYYPTQSRDGANVTTTATPVAPANSGLIAPAPTPATSPSLAAQMATPAPSAATPPPPAAAPAKDVPIQNLWRSDAALDAASDLMKQQKYSDALTLLEQAIQRNMRNADAHVFSAICWTNLGDLNKAKNALSNALAIDKGHMGAYLVGGVVALQEGDKTQANYYLSAIRTVCQGDLCAEYQTLRKAINGGK